MKVSELLQEDWESSIKSIVRKMGIDADVTDGTVTLKDRRHLSALKDACAKERIMMPKIKMVEEIISEKKPAGAPKWHDSDAPDANGKFKELGVNDLADWLIKTRGGDMQKISGSLNQQIVFNRKKNPGYAKKMESVRAAVKRKLAAKKD